MQWTQRGRSPPEWIGSHCEFVRQGPPPATLNTSRAVVSEAAGFPPTDTLGTSFLRRQGFPLVHWTRPVQSFLRRQGSPCYTKHVLCSRFWGVSPPPTCYSLAFAWRCVKSDYAVLSEAACSPPGTVNTSRAGGGLFAAPPYRSQPYIQIYVMQMEHFFAKTVFLLPPPLSTFK